MTARLVISPAANRDIDIAMAWYDDRRENLTNRFIASIQQRFDYMLKNPLAATPVAGTSVRRTAVHGFPYAIFYRLVNDIVRVIAVIHTSRDPKYISSRLRP